MASSFAPPKLADFILTERLGSGTYATVYKAYRKGDNREVVAVKVVGKKTLNKVSMENLLTEIEILKTVRHPHIVQLNDFQWDSENIYLILEWCSGGDLSRFIHSRRLLPERVARLFLQQIACALQYLHNHNISHLDLKPQNILLSGSVLKLAETLFGRAPFASRSYAELEEKIRSDKPIELPAGARVSRNCRDLLLRLLDRDPDTRLTFTQFFSHPWVDLEHMPNAESLGKAKDLVLKAVQKDQEGDRSAALSLYCSALEHFVPAIHYETDRLRKDALRQKVSQYVSRAEELKALVSADNNLCFEQFKSTRDILREMSRDQPRVLAALELASTAIAMEENGIEDHDTLALYQQSLGELLLALAAEAQGRRRELLHGEIKSLMTRAEYLKEQIKMLETQKDVSMDREPLSESVRSSCCVQ
ncbi:serine/threonine-protein kinase ULK3 isoform X4 [Oncorhynchus kisutch]|uniref:serine/threonine-protein kinase ULK3 isoform X4 n=1 Tax=Oncorhynchus kisutch TaxID=8019 RepID=UPI0012DD81D8|nr:serine/threonine-protein kinase ULK3 isoform X4 [Oncorhynchus kisutch]XP_031687047.1 serine/threonine-protein kinase ULK3 isoform X4 [Oncorhynchus kisutch]